MSKPPFELFLSPPYCPNPLCLWHLPERAAGVARFSRQGSRPVTRFPYQTRRFACALCGKVFSDSIFHLFYRDRTEATYEQVFHSHRNGQSRRELSRDLDCSLDTVQRRFRKLSSQGFLQQAWRTKGLEINEPIAFDGLENFAFSQYDPNNVNHALGASSLFIYDFNYCPLNRKGRMTEAQKERLEEIEKEHGRYPRDAIQRASRQLIERLLKRTKGPLELRTDDHHAYARAIASLPNKDRISHSVTSSKKARNYRNKLFAVNHADMLSRRWLPTFTRETIAFAKHSIGMIESFSILMTYKNFMRPKFTKRQKKNSNANLESPAMAVGVETKILTFREFFKMRIQKTQVELNENWRDFIDRVDPYSRRPIAFAPRPKQAA